MKLAGWILLASSTIALICIVGWMVLGFAFLGHKVGVDPLQDVNLRFFWFYCWMAYALWTSAVLFIVVMFRKE